LQRKIDRKSFHEAVYFAGLCLFAISLPASRYFLTVSEIVLAANWLAEGQFRSRFGKLRSDGPALAFMLIYAVNIIGLLWSHDTGYAFKSDLVHKAPTFFLPLILATTPVPDRKRIRALLFLFIASVLVVSFIGFFGRLIRSDLNFRDASPYIPGVYMGMMLIVAAFQLPLLVRQMTAGKWQLALSLAVSGWLIFFVFYLRAMSSIASLAAILIFVVIVLTVKVKGLVFKISLPAILVIVAIIALWPLAGIYKQTHAETAVDLGNLPAYTARGNPYVNDTVSIITENGNRVYIFLCDKELREAWNARSSLDFDGRDLMGQELKATLYRYMSSKGLRKDGDGLAGLTDKDIHAIEKGIPNYLNVDRPGIYVRAYEEIMSLSIYNQSLHRETSWGSLTKRIELWRAAIVSFKKHPLLGWGTGGILKAMDYGLGERGSSLSGLNLKPHNQYLYLLLTLGLAGLVVTACLYGYFAVRTGALRSFMFVLVLIMFLVNFIGNNSLETQPGQDLFVFVSLVYAWFYPSLKKGPGFIY